MPDGTPPAPPAELAGEAAADQRRETRRGWSTVAGGTVIQVLISGLLTQTFGGYVVLLRAEFGWSSTLLAGAYSMFRVESNLLGPLQGWLTDRYGPRRIMGIGVFLLGVGLLLFARVDAVWQFFGAFVLMALGASFAGWQTLVVAIVRAFRRRRSLPMSVAKTGVGIGGLAAPLVLGMLAWWGWRTTALVSGVIVLVLGSLCMVAVERRRRPDPAAAGRSPAPDRDADGDGQFSARQAMRTPAFWFLSLGHTSAVMIVSALMVHLVPYLIEQLGFSLQSASFVVAGMVTMQLVGVAAGGLLGDRLSKRGILTATMLMHGSGVLCLTLATGQALALVVGFLVLHGLAWGARAPLIQALRADYFGAASFGTIAGFSSLLVTVGNITGPLLAGAFYDVTGDYRVGFALLAVSGLLGSLFFLLARPPTARPAGPAEVVPDPPDGW
jgi:MFS family permease